MRVATDAVLGLHVDSMDTGVIDRWVNVLEQVELTDKGVNGRNLRRALANGLDVPSAFDVVRLVDRPSSRPMADGTERPGVA